MGERRREGGGGSFKRAVTDDGSGMRDIFPYQRGSRHAEEIRESAAQPTDTREANSGGCAGRAPKREQQTRGKHVEWRAAAGPGGETGLECKCCSHPLKLLEGYSAKQNERGAHEGSRLSSALCVLAGCRREAADLTGTKEFIFSRRQIEDTPGIQDAPASKKKKKEKKKLVLLNSRS